MKKQRLFAVLLAALMLAALFAACGGGKDDAAEIPQDTAAAETAAETTEEDTVYKADIPEGTDFGGYNFRFFHWYHSGWQERINKDLVAEEMNGDFLNDAVYERNRNVEELLNIKITSQLEDLGAIGGKVQKAVSAGDDAWDAVYIRLYEAPTYLSGGIFMNYHDIPTIELSAPWWDQGSVEQLSIDRRLYLIASDINVIDKNATAGIAFNKSYAESYGLPDLYALVRDGKWTLSKIEELYQNAARDIDGDGEMGIHDQYGFLSKNDAMTFFFHGTGGRFITKDENDLPVFSFPTEKNFTVTGDIIEMTTDYNVYFNQHYYGTSVVSDQAYTKMFENGQGLFFLLRLDEIEHMRASETDFGVLPIPKYSEEQDTYYSTVSQHTCGLMSIPVTISDPSRDGIILEALAAESKNLVQPAYYEVNLQGKYIRDNESGEMLEIILANRVYDLGCIYSFGDFANQYQEMTLKKNPDIASLTAKYESKAIAAIDKVVAQYQELAG
ncbi:MAG TPA: hypothetical protein GX704_04835 [Clostridiales bacterium]|jgi:hypothetical protein|nr:hypothetical protein [Clostridiales bacterium]